MILDGQYGQGHVMCMEFILEGRRCDILMYIRIHARMRAGGRRRAGRYLGSRPSTPWIIS